ncbi:hypothetical protein GUJ93_ZPchr0002g25237 [Zizania palustris]|nr:hypothetical protein GUJ93_ZPchr0002g25237 [Zizania palustris]
MGKYMRKCKGVTGEEVAAAVEVTQVVGVRTRSRSASTATRGAVVKVQAPSRRKALLTEGDSAVGTRRDSGSCYLQLRSRMLFMAGPPARAPGEAAEGAGNGAAHAAGLSRCSSTASSVDMAGQDRSLACRSDVADAASEHVPEISASDSASGRDRDRREMTPSSFLPGDVSDLESDLAGQKRSRPLHSATGAAQEAARPLVPPAAEIEEFFAAAEEAEAKRFAAK